MKLKFKDLNSNIINEEITKIRTDLVPILKRRNIIGSFLLSFFDELEEEKDPKVQEGIFYLYLLILFIFSVVTGLLFSSFKAFLIAGLGSFLVLTISSLIFSAKFKRLNFKAKKHGLLAYNFKIKDLNDYYSTLDEYHKDLFIGVIENVKKSDSLIIKKNIFEEKFKNSSKEEIINEKSDIINFITKFYGEEKRHKLLKEFELKLEREDSNDQINRINEKLGNSKHSTVNQKQTLTKTI